MIASTLQIPAEAEQSAPARRPHVSRVARLLRYRLGLKSDAAAQRKMERARAIVAELALIARQDHEAADWFRWWLAPGLAGLKSAEIDGTLFDAIGALAVADSNEEIARNRWLLDPTPENKSRYAAALRLQEARSEDAIALLEG